MESVQQWIAVLTTVLIFVLINVRRHTPIDLLFLIGLLIVTVAGILTPTQALKGFAHPAVITIGSLLAIAAALRKCGVLDWVGSQLLGKVEKERGAIWRLALALISSSAFLLNTALVAMMVPVISKWCRIRDVAPSRLLIPVSYLAILGGVCSLIGTSTTLVVQAELQASSKDQAIELAAINEHVNRETNPELLAKLEKDIERVERRQRDLAPMSLFELGKVGLPCAVVGGVLVVFLIPRLLPNREGIAGVVDDNRREYIVEMQVEPGCPLIGKGIKKAGLRNLPGLFLVEIDRSNTVITPVAPDEEIEAGDRLVFSGLVETIVDLKRIKGLVPATSDPIQEDKYEKQRELVEVVLSPSSPLIRSTVRSINFRQRYNAAVVAVHRNGEQVSTKIGQIRLQPGDTLLLQTGSTFVQRYRNNNEFYLVSSYGASEPQSYRKRPLAAAIFLGLLLWLVVTNLSGAGQDSPIASPAIASLVAVALLLVTSCMRMVDARSAIDIGILITIACALGLGVALEESGAARAIAEGIVGWIGNNNQLALLIAIYVMTMLMTEMITNNAVAALMYPIAVNTAIAADCNARPFIIAICLAASLAFLTPIGYQTNLMVMGPGGYRPRDFLKAGLPVSISVAVVAIVLIPVFWPF